MAAGPIFRGAKRALAQDRARDWLRRVGLTGFEDRYPHQLSGGMRKRVALAQSFINEPEILLLDEPFSALDVQTRSIMSDELLSLWQLTQPSVVFITHDLEEAIALADKVVVLSPGRAPSKRPMRSTCRGRAPFRRSASNSGSSTLPPDRENPARRGPARLSAADLDRGRLNDEKGANPATTTAAPSADAADDAAVTVDPRFAAQLRRRKTAVYLTRLGVAVASSAAGSCSPN